MNAGIGGNLITGPADYSPQMPYPGGPAALQRLERDVLSLSGVSAVIWFEGINDFSKNGNVSVEAAANALREGVGIDQETPSRRSRDRRDRLRRRLATQARLTASPNRISSGKP